MTMRIGELARSTDCPVETIRYYESAGLLPTAPRSAGNYRLYGREHVERLQFIRNCRFLDMTLDEIRTLLRLCESQDRNCEAVNDLLDEHIGHVSERMAELKVLERQLRRLRRLCGKPGVVKDCGILNQLACAASPHAQAAGHVHGAHGRGQRR
jgi:Cd(II)/Pb(II)-responsive transcriptional regulator